MRTYLSRAIAYVERHGSELERWRLRGILGDRHPDPRVIRVILSKQNEDGGFPYDLIPGRPSSVHHTLTVLSWLRDLRFLGRASFPAAGPGRDVEGAMERIVTYLFTTQRPDGSWDENPAVVKFDPPLAVRPGSPLARTATTAQVGYWLALLGYESDHAVSRALDYLRSRHVEGRFEGFPHTTWFALALFARAEGITAKVVEEARASLAATPIDRWDAPQLASMLDCLCEAGVGRWEPLVDAGLQRLLALQSPDGGWGSGDNLAAVVDTTLHALRVLISYGVPATPASTSLSGSVGGLS